MFEIFKNLALDEATHTYKLGSHTFKYSVTEFIGKFCQPFDKNHWSKFVANRDKITQEEVLAQWEERARFSSEKGNLFHQYMEDLIHNFMNEMNQGLPYDNPQLKEKAMCFFQEVIETRRIIPIAVEKSLFDLELDIAGTLDFFGINAQGEYIILDWKTNREIKKENKFSKMLSPFEAFDDCNFYHYSLQLNIYRYILEKHCNITIPYLYFIWFNESESRYKLFKCFDMRESLKKLFIKSEEDDTK